MRLLLGAVLIACAGAWPRRHYEQFCGYKSCPKYEPDLLNVHIVAHTHDDVGWLKTFDQYYYGNKNNIQQAGVQYILDSVVEALVANPERKFIYVETAYFWKWWQEQSEHTKEVVKELVNQGRLEFIGGAWSMNDEACTHYQSTIDQFTWGFRKLDDLFGECGRPRIGWQIDPFGHSREMGSLFAQFGFDGLLFARLDWREKNVRLENRTAEMVWKTSSSLDDSDMFTSVLYNHYSAPPNFCFDVLCPDEPMIDNKKSPDYNAERRANEFLAFIQEQAKYYTTNNIIITMGGDFTYQDAHMQFKNIDKLIKAVNQMEATTGVRLVYSTPSCYVKSVHDAAQKPWPVKTDDFFPYASDPHTYWSGYFTSRPTIKRFERLGNNFLQVAKQITVLAGGGVVDAAPQLDPLREAMGVMQHHDAITGTEKQAVSDDYARMLTAAIDETLKALDESVSKHTRRSMQNEIQDSVLKRTDLHSCLSLNISQCSLSEERDLFAAVLYNPLSRPVNYYARIPVPSEKYEVTIGGNVVQSQIVPVPDFIQNIPGRDSKAKFDLVFEAQLPPLGFSTYLVVMNNKINNKKAPVKPHPVISVAEDGKKIVFKTKEGDVEVRQNFSYYLAAKGDNTVFERRASGAYIFRPKTQDSISTGLYDLKKYEGPIVTELHMKLNDWISQIIRLYANENHVEYKWIVGPIPVNDTEGKEVMSTFSSDLENDGKFYTDANGRQVVNRQRDSRETWNLTMEEPVAQNFYPVTSKIGIQDRKTGVRMAVLNDRSQAGASLKDGDVTLMVHRRLLHDDAFGVGEALDEQSYGTGLVATGSHFVVVADTTAVERELAQRKLMEPWLFLAPLSDATERGGRHIGAFSGLSASLPDNVQVLTLEPWDEATILLRLEHIFEKDEHPEMSQPVTVNVKDMFSVFNVVSMQEMALGANQPITDVERLKWKTDRTESAQQAEGQRDEFDVVLSPMQIRTFVVKIEPNHKK